MTLRKSVDIDMATSGGRFLRFLARHRNRHAARLVAAAACIAILVVGCDSGRSAQVDIVEATSAAATDARVPEQVPVRARIRTGYLPDFVTSGAGSIWVGHGDGSLARINPRTNRVVARIQVAGRLGPLAVGHGSVWAVDYAENLYKIDPTSNNVIDEVPVGFEPNIALSPNAIWVTHDAERVSRIDPDRLRIEASMKVPQELGTPPLGDSSPVFWMDSLWVPHMFTRVARIDATTLHMVDDLEVNSAPKLTTAGTRLLIGSVDRAREVGTLHAITGGSALADVLEGPWDIERITASSDQVWVRPAVGTLLALCPDVADWRQFHFPDEGDEGYPSGVHFAFGSLWAANVSTGAVWRIDPAQTDC